MRVQEFIIQNFQLKETYQRNDGTIVKKYCPKIDLYVDSLNPETGEIERTKVIELSIHENIEMYKIEDKKGRFVPFYASYDHSLIIYDSVLNSYEKISPREILEMCIAPKSKMYLVKVENSGEKLFIPLTDIVIERAPEVTVAYDLTLEKNYTFIANDIVVQDTMATYAVNIEESKKELFEKRAHALTMIRYIRNNEFLHQFEHEYLYMLYELTRTDKIENVINEIKTLEEFAPSSEILFKDDFRKYGIKIGEKVYPYGLVYINKKLFGNEIVIDITDIDKKKISKINEKILEYSIRTTNSNNQIEIHRKYFDLLHKLQLILSGLSISNVSPKLTIEDYKPIREIEKYVKNLPEEPITGIYILRKLSKIVIEKIAQKETELYKVFITGARAKKEQIEQTILAKGYLADAYNKIIGAPVKSALSKGLSKRELFISSYGSRKGEIDKMEQTPRSGFLQRIGLYNLSFIMFDENVEDCGTNSYFEIEIKDEKHAKSLIGRYYFDETKNEEILIDENNYKEIIGKEIKLRSPLTCKLEGFKVCKKCGGYDSVEQRKQLGMIAIQNIVERFTQLILRTFHTSGKANIDIPEEILDKYDFDIDENGAPVVKNGALSQMIVEVNNWLKDNGYNYEIVYDNSKRKLKGKGTLINKDIVYKLRFVEKVLRSKIEEIDLHEVYEMLIELFLSIENIKSVFIETILTPLWFIDFKIKKRKNNNNEIEEENSEEINEIYLEVRSKKELSEKTLRYFIVNNGYTSTRQIDYSKTVKLSLPQAAKALSPIIQLIFEPNRSTIQRLIREEKKDYIETAFDKLFK